MTFSIPQIYKQILRKSEKQDLDVIIRPCKSKDLSLYYFHLLNILATKLKKN